MNTELKVGDVVLLSSDNKKRDDWLMGKIVELFPGLDGKIRVTKVKVKGNHIVRPTRVSSHLKPA